MRQKSNRRINQPAKKWMTGKQAPVKPWAHYNKAPVQKSNSWKHGASKSDESDESTSKDEPEPPQHWSCKKAKHAPAAEEFEEEAEEPEPLQHWSHRKANHAPEAEEIEEGEEVEPAAEEICEEDVNNNSDADNMRSVQGNGNEDEVSKSWQQWTTLVLTILIAGWSYKTTSWKYTRGVDDEEG